MSKWKERADQALARITEEEARSRALIESNRHAAELSKQRENAQQEARRQKALAEKEATIRAKAEVASKIVSNLDRLSLEQALKEINEQIWENQGKVDNAVLTVSGIPVGRKITLSSLIPHHAEEVTEDIYKKIQKHNKGHTHTSMGETTSHGGYSYWGRGKAGVRVVGSKLAPERYALGIRYGFQPEQVTSDVPLPDTTELVITQRDPRQLQYYSWRDPHPPEFSQEDIHTIHYQDTILMPQITQFTQTVLDGHCVERRREPFSAIIQEANRQAGIINARIGEERMLSGVIVKPPGIIDRASAWLKGSS